MRRLKKTPFSPPVHTEVGKEFGWKGQEIGKGDPTQEGVTEGRHPEVAGKPLSLSLLNFASL